MSDEREQVCTCDCDEGYVDSQGVERCVKCKLPDAASDDQQAAREAALENCGDLAGLSAEGATLIARWMFDQGVVWERGRGVPEGSRHQDICQPQGRGVSLHIDRLTPPPPPTYQAVAGRGVPDAERDTEIGPGSEPERKCARCEHPRKLHIDGAWCRHCSCPEFAVAARGVRDDAGLREALSDFLTACEGIAPFNGPEANSRYYRAREKAKAALAAATPVTGEDEKGRKLLAETAAGTMQHELEIVGNFLAAGKFTVKRVAILKDRIDKVLAACDAGWAAPVSPVPQEG